MPTTTGVFNAELFKKRIRQADSSDGDGAVALTQAVKQCREHEPPVHFYEAIVEAFGKNDAAQWKARNEKLEQENSYLREQLEEETQTEPETPKGTSAWPDDWALQPKQLVIFASVLAGIEWLIGSSFGHYVIHGDRLLIVMWLHMLTLAIFGLWAVAVFKLSGVSQLILRVAVWGAGWFALLGWMVYRHGDAKVTHTPMMLMLLPVNWWSGARMNIARLDLLVVFLVLVVALDVNLRGAMTGWVIAKVRNTVED